MIFNTAVLNQKKFVTFLFHYFIMFYGIFLRSENIISKHWITKDRFYVMTVCYVRTLIGLLY